MQGEKAIHPKPKKKYSSSIRIWHWVNMLAIAGLLLTVLVNSIITNKHVAIAAFKQETNKVEVSDQQVAAVVHVLREKVWDIHVYFGYGLTALLLFRIILEYFQFADQKFIKGFNNAYQNYKTTKENRVHNMKKFTAQMMYAVFYLLVVVMVSTGLTLAFEDDLALSKTLSHNVKEVHGFCMYLILTFIVLHLVGVFLSEQKQDKGIVSDMINGG